MSGEVEILDIGDEVPNFNLESQVGMISFHEMIDAKWCVLVTYRTAFEPVGTTDIGTLTKMLEEFEARNIAVLVVGHENGENRTL
jgi:alkyl hydroperoxide reductase subunit AhpC